MTSKPTPNAIEHNGGPCPVAPETRVRVWFREGEPRIERAGFWKQGCFDWWKHEGPDHTDILFYEPLDAPVAETAVVPKRYRHKKRGTTYKVIGQAQIQCPADSPLTEYEVVTVYRSEVGTLDDEHGLWVRRKSEFEDGRFEALYTAPTPPVAGEDAQMPERCPACKISWRLFPPVNHDDEVLLPNGKFKFMPTTGYRCVECKRAYRIAQPSTPTPREMALVIDDAAVERALTAYHGNIGWQWAEYDEKYGTTHRKKMDEALHAAFTTPEE